MEVNFKFNEPKDAEPIRIEQVFAEKLGGGVVVTDTDLPPCTPVGYNEDGDLIPVVVDESGELNVTPSFVTGNWAYADSIKEVRLINGANLNKHSVDIAQEILAHLPNINLV